MMCSCVDSVESDRVVEVAWGLGRFYSECRVGVSGGWFGVIGVVGVVEVVWGLGRFYPMPCKLTPTAL